MLFCEHFSLAGDARITQMSAERTGTCMTYSDMHIANVLWGCGGGH